MAFAVLSGFVLAAFAPWFVRWAGPRAGWIIGILPLGLFVYFGTHVDRIAAGEVHAARHDWAPLLGVAFSFRLDGLALVFALLISGIGTLVMVYAGAYLGEHRDLGRLYLALLAFMAAMLGVVLADNVLTLFVFWELTTLTSYLLIGFDHEREGARGAALQSLLVTAVGGQALLAGLVLLGIRGGSFELSALAASGDAIRGDALYLPILGLILLGAFTKSAQVPFHFWLPGAMAAPTPVSAYLHSATMVKAGVYLLARLNPTLGGTDAWRILLTVAGAATMLVGILLALRQTDLKLILAYTTVSALGVLVFALGIGSAAAISAGIVFLIAHSLYKGALFLVVGAIDHETGTREVTRLGGLRRTMPITALAALFAGLSMAGVPPLVGFIGKELVLKAGLEAAWGPVLAVVATATAAMTVAAAGWVALHPFFGAPAETPKRPHEAPLALWLGPVLLAVLGLVFGVVTSLIAGRIVTPAASAVLGEPTAAGVALWQGLNLAVVLSAGALVSGAFLYMGRHALRRAATPLEALAGWTPTNGYHLALDGMNRIARLQTRILQNGYLRAYLMIIFAFMLFVAGWTLLVRDGYRGARLDLEGVRFYEAGLALLILGAAVIAVLVEGRLAAVAALGVLGYGIALIYVLHGAPDLAMTQILVDTLFVILFVLVLYRLPRFANLSKRGARLRDAAVAVTVGALITTLVLVASNQTIDRAASRFYAEESVPTAQGRNIVNVILVDFRALDTFGEITVLAAAGLGVYSLMRLRPREEKR